MFAEEVAFVQGDWWRQPSAQTRRRGARTCGACNGHIEVSQLDTTKVLRREGEERWRSENLRGRRRHSEHQKGSYPTRMPSPNRNMRSPSPLRGGRGRGVEVAPLRGVGGRVDATEVFAVVETTLPRDFDVVDDGPQRQWGSEPEDVPTEAPPATEEVVGRNTSPHVLLRRGGSELSNIPGGADNSRASDAFRFKSLSKDVFLKGYFGLVVSIAKKVAGKDTILDDLIQQGMVGLCKAYDKFDVSRGVKFSSYATYWIRAEVQAARRDNRLIRQPKHMHDLSDRIRRASRQLLSVTGRNPSVGAIAAEIGESETTVSNCLSHMLKKHVEMCCDTEWHSIQWHGRGPDSHVSEICLREHVQKALCAVLNEREQIVIRKLFALDGQMVRPVEIARSFGVSHSRVRQIERRALDKIKVHLLEEQGGSEILFLHSDL
mmetsp:Transcript_8462/g.25426  ORF Transcript_8462/g.25426 Transcript_8462/m.25426 type:complete len:433 (+) Transcript_8462:90-1388(+)